MSLCRIGGNPDASVPHTHDRTKPFWKEISERHRYVSISDRINGVSSRPVPWFLITDELDRAFVFFHLHWAKFLLSEIHMICGMMERNSDHRRTSSVFRSASVCLVKNPYSVVFVQSDVSEVVFLSHGNFCVATFPVPEDDVMNRRASTTYGRGSSSIQGLVATLPWFKKLRFHRYTPNAWALRSFWLFLLNISHPYFVVASTEETVSCS